MTSEQADPLASPKNRRLTAAARSRVVIALLIGCCLGVVGLAVVGQAPQAPALEFTQSGHWVYSSGLQSALHVDGATGQVDAQANVPGAAEDSQVVQGGSSGFVVDRSRITEFSKSTLSVQHAVDPPTPETPVALEVAGGPYLVYRNAGQVVRLGDPTATVPAGGPVANPVVTTDGTVWLLRIDTGALCDLPRNTTQLTCLARLPAGHTGELAVVGDRPVVLDLTGGMMQPVGASGLGAGAPLGVQLSAAAQVAGNAVDGRLAVIDQRNLVLIDTAGLTNRPAATPVTVALPQDGTFTGPVAASHTVAVVDQTSHRVLTFDSRGRSANAMSVPGSAGTSRLAVGQDARIYVDSPDGSHVLIVNGQNGSAVDVDVNGHARTAPSASRHPAGVATGSTTAPPSPANRAADAPTVGATADSGGQLTVSWTAPNLHGASLVHYLVSVPGQGDRTVTGTSTSYQGLTGTVTITVRAITRYGSTGGLLTGNPGTHQVTMANATGPATVKIVSVRSVSSNLIVTVDADGKGGPATCQATFLYVSSAWVPCSGVTEVTISGVSWFGSITITATANNSVGSGTDSWTGVPTVSSSFVFWFGPALLAGTRRPKKKAGNRKGAL